jgi:nucleoside-diphosphate-sugar epimerase
MKALITGGTGMIGGVLARRLKDDGWEVKTPVHDLSLWAGADVAFSAFDMRFDYIFHCADVCRGLEWTKKHPGEQFLANAAITTNVLRAWKEHQGRATFVGFSSGWAYPAGAMISTEGFYWSGHMHPDIEQYGIIKKMLGVGIQALKRQYGMDGTMLTLGNVYGPGDASTRVIPSILKRMLSNADRLEVYGSETDERDFVFIDDQVEGILRHRNAKEPLVNIASGRLTTVGEVVRTIVELATYKGDVVFLNKEIGTPRGFDLSLSRRLTGWPDNMTFHSLREGLRKTMEVA